MVVEVAETLLDDVQLSQALHSLAVDEALAVLLVLLAGSQADQLSVLEATGVFEVDGSQAPQLSVLEATGVFEVAGSDQADQLLGSAVTQTGSPVTT